jgi:hypothetical protein
MSLEVVPIVPNNIGGQLVYAVKFVCGTIPPADPTIPQVPPPGSPLVPGTYMTAINIHNPWPEAVEFVKLALVTIPQNPDQKRGPVGQPQSESLKQEEGLEVDCANIQDLLGRPDFDPARDFVKGFVVIKPRKPQQILDVVAVYTLSLFVK